MAVQNEALLSVVKATVKLAGGDLRLLVAVGTTLVTSVLINLLRRVGDRRPLTHDELERADSALHMIMREVRRGLAEFPNMDTTDSGVETVHRSAGGVTH